MLHTRLAMNASPIMSVAANQQLMSLATAHATIDRAAATGGVGQILEARQLTEIRSQLRQGETFSITA